jgi:splicing factor U2AF subunit
VRKRENKKLVNYMLDSDNKLYMGGIPVTAKDDEVRRVVEAFGQIKTFNLVKDSNDDNLNRGFCFFEYLDEKVTERAIRVHLPNFRA